MVNSPHAFPESIHDPSAPYPRMPSYLSPNSYMEFLKSPVYFYLRRLAPEEWKPPGFKQTEPMAVGNVFDTHVKFALRRQLGKDLPADLLEQIVDPEHLRAPSMVLLEGLRVYRAYRDSPAYAGVLKELVDVEVPALALRQGHPELVDGVPIWGKPDGALRKPSGELVVLDWKVTGAMSTKETTSPEPGYKHRWVERTSGWHDEGMHRRYLESLENINKRWGIQLAMYSWMMGGDPSKRQHVAIDQCVVNGAPGISRIEVCQIRTTITVEFQDYLLRDLHRVWRLIQNGEVLPPEYRSLPPEVIALSA